MEQPSLFSMSDLRQVRHSSLVASPQLDMSAPTLKAWTQRIVQYQQGVRQEHCATQGLLFGSGGMQVNPQTLDPFALRSHNIECWRWPAQEPGVAALYFVIDHERLLLLYVGETCKANQRWKGVHDCKRYVQNYIAAHRCHHLPVSVRIGFWTEAPVATRPRQRLELALIHQWRSPFNKENWRLWGTPFLGGKG